MIKKFRVWDKENKMMYYELPITEYGILLDGTIINHEIGVKDNFILQQYTTLTDSKNNDIYEGDILEIKIPTFYNKYKKGIYKVFWDTHKWSIIRLDSESNNIVDLSNPEDSTIISNDKVFK
tara:strand:+ start:1336 stop:1701 length:366 start_codon:yes stop_codon:yes gene_type:complete